VNPAFQAGDLMLIRDHVNLLGCSPLEGPNVDAWGPRFPDMSHVYPGSLRLAAAERAEALGLRLVEGVYAACRGPQYETPAEVRMLSKLGIDAVGMSSVPEAIVAAHMGVPVLGISLISNAAAGLSGAPLSHADVLEAAERSGQDLARLVTAMLGGL
jgi:purine-nucleoside phosphorylase